jgi:hypothetical protein
MTYASQTSSEEPPGSKVEFQNWTQRARDGNHHRSDRRLVRFPKHRIPMIRPSRKNNVSQVRYAPSRQEKGRPIIRAFNRP